MVNGEYFLSDLGYTVYRRDLLGQKGGGLTVLLDTHFNLKKSLNLRLGVNTSEYN